MQIEGYWEYNKFYEEGVYNCAGCATPLYKSSTKFDSGYGWPAFFEGLLGAINRSPDPYGRRTEITCAACGGHLGHVFKGEGFKTPTDERHCVDAERAYHRNALVILEKLYTELFLLNSSGKKFWNLFHMQPMRDQKREVQYFIGVQLDDTQHVEPLHNCITENTAKEGEQLILDSGEQVL
ncbi:hypothetical protein HN51_001671 [Arachis hypogaea]